MNLTGGTLGKFANASFGGGYLKPWKAFDMLGVIAEIPGIMEDPDRLRAYVKECLTMEGFTESACNEIAEFIRLDGDI